MAKKLDQERYSAKLELMEGDDLIDLEYYLASELEEHLGAERAKFFRQIELIQKEFTRRGY
jgi:hypothetical protein